ncbi:DUF1479-domain-containing protein [Cylindrobasidium torrendii FP15055 ss-10]|uniref:DUF1479-domain-containing protein n=1 Tax=Cylindrobasidium torrendii FP15055 ss-10 TaxID=1314674 RepID=A0A0D7BT24_9AGAR|nr:DUF1479-domain-containing protein [Cylindrobasidium torrendii FP15055 ss-10]
MVLLRPIPTLNALRATVRGFATAAQAGRRPREEGNISSIFTSLGANSVVLPERFAQLKRDLFREEMITSWNEVVDELEVVTEQVAEAGSNAIPRFSYADIRDGLSSEQEETIRKVGSVIIAGAVPPEEALGWKASVRSYTAENKPRVKGFPVDDPQVFEFYHTKAQIAARTHPDILNTQRILMSLWKGDSPDISMTTPISYFDRLRIRMPGDAQFALGPHVDGGSLERWEEPTFRAFYNSIFNGNWRQHNPFDADKRTEVIADLYHTPNQCTIFRPFQGWTSLSTTGPGEGTLRLLPFLPLSSAYILLRPFFRPPSSNPGSLKDWVPDLESTAFPGAVIGNTQELNPQTHPHLKLEKTMVPVPLVQPGDQVYWHCDSVHAVENVHAGKSDSSVFYIPAAPLTTRNADYLRDQRLAFTQGIPPPDFPGGEGESKNVNRASVDDAHTAEGRMALGFAAFPESIGASLAKKANSTLGL